jgi:hypothetical protein
MSPGTGVENKSGAAPDMPPRWRYLRLDQYALPPEPARETVRKGIGGLWGRLHRGWRPLKSVFDEKKLASVPGKLLDQVAPPPRWDEALDAVTAALNDWLEATPAASGTRVLVGPPYGGLPEILGSWAGARGWRLVEPPAADQILAGPDEWLEQVGQDEGAPLVLPRLERCFLRHFDGLTLVQRLLDHLFSRRRRGLIGCDTWAWAFLSKVLQIDSVFPTPLTLEAFDLDRLTRWLQELAQSSGDFVFRQPDNGKFVLPPSGEETAPREPGPREGPEVTDFLKNLAAYSRGIPGVAWAIWRYSLRFGVEENLAAEARKEADLDLRRTIWVEPWGQLKLPTIPDVKDRRRLLLVLHALLLHSGLTGQVLPELLPLTPTEIMETLHLLKAAGLLTEEQGFWRVAPLGYPAVRQYVKKEGYLIDAI